MTRRSKKNLHQAANRKYYYEDYDFSRTMERDLYSRAWRTALTMPYGKDRRTALLKLMSSPGEYLTVNRRYCPNLKYDVDLVKMLKAGVLVRFRTGGFSTKKTVLRLA